MLGAFAGSSGIGEWRNYLLWRNGGSFGEEDAWFGKDIGFYVFDLPWLHYLVDFAMAALVISLIAAAVVHYLYGGIRLQASRDRLSGPAQVQLSILLGLFVLAKGADYYLDRFDLVTQGGGLITGMTYTDHHAVLPAKNILLGIAVICAILFFVNVWRRTWLLPSVGLALLAVSAILLGLIWPGIVQQFQVKPSEADREAEYIQANIDATRLAYDVDDVEVEEYTPSSDLTGGLDALDEETSSVPLVDPLLVRDAFEQNQQVRAYYSVADVLDVDRYDIGGTERALVLGVRELDQSGIPAGDQNWSNLHTVYTHGNGVIAAYANQRPEDNRAQIDTTSAAADSVGIEWAEGTNVGQSELSEATGGFENRIYYGEQSPDYSIVGKASDESDDVELNLPLAGSDLGATTTYDGAGDAGVGGTFNQLMFAVKYGEPNFLLSGRVNENSRILFDRDPRERVQKVAPWLTVDSDVYPAIVDGRIQWIVDGYTTTDRYPNAEKESFQTMTDDSLQQDIGLRTLPTDEINYMRNAVKARSTPTPARWSSTPGTRRTRSCRPGARRSPERSRTRSRSRPSCSPTCGTPRTCSRSSATSSPATTSPRPRRSTRQQPVGGPRGPVRERQVPAAVPALRRQPGHRRRGLLAHLGLRAVREEQPGLVRVGGRRRDRRRLRQDPRAPASQRADARTGPGRQPVRLGPERR